MGFETHVAVVHGFGVSCVMCVRRCAMWKNLLFIALVFTAESMFIKRVQHWKNMTVLGLPFSIRQFPGKGYLRCPKHKETWSPKNREGSKASPPPRGRAAWQNPRKQMCGSCARGSLCEGVDGPWTAIGDCNMEPGQASWRLSTGVSRTSGEICPSQRLGRTDPSPIVWHKGCWRTTGGRRVQK